MLDISIYGLVQGVGFRPFVAEAARELSISGTVRNAGGIVKIQTASGDREASDEFIRRLSSCDIPGVRIDEIVVSEVEADDSGMIIDGEFRIIESEEQEDELRFLPADIATCATCEAELMDPANRRYRYPFISCVSCGPRFSIMKGVPYDRERTTMASFPLCEECQKDYLRVGDIRRHAQTIACADCGPNLTLQLEHAVELLKQGKVVAVKDIGGYHFCFDPNCEDAAERLREYKNRENKPLAVMFSSVDAIREMAVVSKKEEELLTSPARPIVLVDKREGKDFAPSVCGTSRRIGAMLPCNPLQILLVKECGALVMTSGNRGGEPIVTRDDVMRKAVEEGFPDAVLGHDREIVNGVDDSIFQVVKLPGENSREIVQVLRRARGFVPEPVRLPFELSEDTFAAGGDLKAVFALGRKNTAYLSGHFGDLADARAMAALEEGIGNLEELMGVRPTWWICDKHPGYVSVRNMKKMCGVEKQQSSVAEEAADGSKSEVNSCQHHYAHVLSVIAEHGLTGPVLGVAFDGTGYGDDGTIWGSELLLCVDGDYVRKGHFFPIPMVGGDASSQDARTSLYAFLHEAFVRDLLTEGEIADVVEHLDGVATMNNYHIVASAIDAGVNIVPSSSMGRVFDAVAALLHVGFYNTYEGECAEALQALAERWLSEREDEEDDIAGVWAPVKESKSFGKVRADSVYLLAMMAKRMMYGENPGRLAYEFHQAVAMATVEMCIFIREEYTGTLSVGEEVEVQENEGRTGIPVALGGGCMCNRLLLQLLVPELEKAGFTVYLNEQVPPGDGGLALGQLMAVHQS